jgi:cytoskeleton protein RodZ
MSAFQNSHAVEIGLELRKAREALGLTVEDVCGTIKVHTSAIEQIERGQLDQLGPAVYARGFVKSYAKCVRMPHDWTLTAMAQLALDTSPTLMPSRGHRAETSTSDRGMQAASYLVGTAILVSGIFYMTQLDRLVAPEVAQVPVVIPEAPVNAAPVADTVTEIPLGMPTASVNPAPTSPIGGENAIPVSVPSVLNPLPAPVVTASSVESAEAPAIAAALGQLPAVSVPDAKLSLAVTGTVWVEITDASGRRLEYNNLTGGARKSYSGTAPYSIKLGNAPNATLSVSGTKIDLAPFTQGSVAKLQLAEVGGVLTPVR